MITLNAKLTKLNTEVEKAQPFEFFVRNIYFHYSKSDSFLANFGYFG